MAKGFSKWIRKQEGHVEPEIVLEPITLCNSGTFFKFLSRQPLGEVLGDTSKRRLKSSFPWDESPQGFNYWNDLFEGVRPLSKEDRIIFENSYDLLCL